MKEQVKYIIFNYSDYMKNALYDLLELPNVTLIDMLSKENVFNRLINSFYLNDNCISRQLNKMHWYNHYFDFDKLNKKDIYIFIFYEINPLSNCYNFLKHLKKDFYNSKFVYVFTNLLEENHLERYYHIKEKNIYDIIITFNKKDAEKYDLIYYEGVYSKKEVSLTGEKSDIYFCGLDKGRGKILGEIYEYLNANKISCNFNLIYTPDKEKYKCDGIKYFDNLINNDRMLADEINSNCILELLANPEHPGSTLRMCEAVAYKKKLITNNQFIKEKWFYNPKQMKIFKDIKDFPIEFVNLDLQEDDYLDENLLTPIKFLNFIEEKLL